MHAFLARDISLCACPRGYSGTVFFFFLPPSSYVLCVHWVCLRCRLLFLTCVADQRELPAPKLGRSPGRYSRRRGQLPARGGPPTTTALPCRPRGTSRHACRTSSLLPGFPLLVVFSSSWTIAAALSSPLQLSLRFAAGERSANSNRVTAAATALAQAETLEVAFRRYEASLSIGVTFFVAPSARVSGSSSIRRSTAFSVVRFSPASIEFSV